MELMINFFIDSVVGEPRATLTLSAIGLDRYKVQTPGRGFVKNKLRLLSRFLRGNPILLTSQI